MRMLILAAAGAALIAAPAMAKTYDCTKPGNANKAQCKAAAASAASTVKPTAAGPAATTTAAAPVKLFGKPATATVKTTTTASGGTMKACAAQWDALSDTQKAAYKTQGEGMKSKNGNKLSGYNVFTGQCMKKK
jgi:hypothetical protein